MEENKLINYRNGLLKKASNTIEITNKLLINRDAEIIDFFLDYPEYFMNIVPAFYKLSHKLIEKYKDKWDFKILSLNPNLEWSEKLIDEYTHKWEWYNLGKNEEIPWSADLLKRYTSQKKLFDSLSRNDFSSWGQQFWTEAIIDQFSDCWHWDSLCYNSSLPWSEKFIEKYVSKFSWRCLSSSAPLSEALIDKYKHNIHWSSLSENAYINWSDKFIEKYKEKWDWNNLSGNKLLPWSTIFFEKHQDKWNWGNLSCNEGLLWSEEFVIKYQDKWDWNNLSANKSLPWSVNFIEKYKEKWDWKILSRNEALPWSLNFFEKYQGKWHLSKLVGNRKFPWSENLFEKNKNLIDFRFDFLHINPSLPWSISFIKNYSIKWSGLIDIFIYVQNNVSKKTKLWDVDWQKIFEPYINDTVIEEVMERIKID